MDLTNFRALGQAIDSTWGRSSTNATSARWSVKAEQHGEDGLSVKYIAVVTLGSLAEWRQMHGIHKDQAVKVVNEYIKQLKKEYSEEGGGTLTLKEVGTPVDSFEAITHSAYSPKKDAYYRVACEYEWS